MSTAAPAKKAQRKTHDLTQPKQWAFQLTEVVSSRGPVVDAKGKIIDDTAEAYRPHLSLKNPCVVYDPVTQRSRMIRLVNGHASIWQDEQDTPVPLAKEYVESNKESVVFKNGYIVLESPRDQSKIAFLLAHDDIAEEGKVRIGGKPPKYRLVSDITADDLNDAIDLEIEAIEKARSVKLMEDIMPHALWLGIKMTDKYNIPLSEKAIKAEYVRKAKTDPALFLKTFDNPKPKAKFLVNKAAGEGIIDLEKIKGQAHWKDTGLLITPLDPQKDAIEYLTEFAIGGSDEGTAFYERLQQLSKS